MVRKVESILESIEIAELIAKMPHSQEHQGS